MLARSPNPKLTVASILIVALSLLPSTALADDIVFLNGGGRLRGVVIAEESTGVTIRLLDGTIRKLPPEEVARVEYGGTEGQSATPPAPASPQPAPSPPSEAPIASAPPPPSANPSNAAAARESPPATDIPETKTGARVGLGASVGGVGGDDTDGPGLALFAEAAVELPVSSRVGLHLGAAIGSLRYSSKNTYYEYREDSSSGYPRYPQDSRAAGTVAMSAVVARPAIVFYVSEHFAIRAGGIAGATSGSYEGNCNGDATGPIGGGSLAPTLRLFNRHTTVAIRVDVHILKTPYCRDKVSSSGSGMEKVYDINDEKGGKDSPAATTTLLFQYFWF